MKATLLLPVAASQQTTYQWIGFPQRGDDIKIPAPKEVVDAARKNFNVRDEFAVVHTELAMGIFDRDPADAIDVLSIPVAMLRDAIDSMDEVKELVKRAQGEN